MRARVCLRVCESACEGSCASCVCVYVKGCLFVFVCVDPGAAVGTLLRRPLGRRTLRLFAGRSLKVDDSSGGLSSKRSRSIVAVAARESGCC